MSTARLRALGTAVCALAWACGEARSPADHGSTGGDGAETSGAGDEHVATGANSLWQWPMGAMVEAISPELQGVGGCNEGFVRDDAILVVVWRGNEDEPLPGAHPWPSSGDPASWNRRR